MFRFYQNGHFVEVRRAPLPLVCGDCLTNGRLQGEVPQPPFTLLPVPEPDAPYFVFCDQCRFPGLAGHDALGLPVSLMNDPLTWYSDPGPRWTLGPGAPTFNQAPVPVRLSSSINFGGRGQRGGQPVNIVSNQVETVANIELVDQLANLPAAGGAMQPDRVAPTGRTGDGGTDERARP